MLWLCLVLAGTPSVSPPLLVAAKKARASKAKHAGPVEAVTTAPPPAPEPTPPPAPVAAPAPSGPPDVLLAEAKRLYDDQEYDRVIPLAEAVLAHAEVGVEQKLDAYLLHGSALAIVGDPIDAEKPFRFLLRGRPSFDLPADTPPKIMAVFRKVQVEERAIVTQMHELERTRMVQSLSLDGEPPKDVVGGYPLPFDYGLRDPYGVVTAMRVEYRRRGEPSFSSLALQRAASGRWFGNLPGEWTENEDGAVIEYFITTADGDGQPLLAVSSPLSPRTITLQPGTVADTIPIYKSPLFWTLVGGATLALGAVGWYAYDQATELPPSDLGEVPLH